MADRDRFSPVEVHTALKRAGTPEALAADDRARVPVSDEDAEAARHFHETYERLAPHFGYETRREFAVPWEQVPANNRALMTAVCREVLALDRAERSRAEEKRAALVEALEGLAAEFDAGMWRGAARELRAALEAHR